MIGKPIPTGEYAGREDDREALWDLRSKAAASIEAMIEQLKQKRAAEDLPGWRRRLLGR